MSRIGSRTGLFALSGSQGVTSIEDMMRSTGRRFFVHATRGEGGTTSGFGDNPDRPFTTMDACNNVIAAAVTAGTLDASDTKNVVVMSGHTESLADATTFVPDAANVAWLAEGRGAARPTITFTNANGNIPISAAGVTMSNFLMTISGTIDVVAGITVSGADCLLTDLEGREAAIDDQFVDFIVGTTCDRMKIERLKFFGATASDQATQAAISVTGTPSRIEIADVWLIGSFTAGGIDISGVATDIMIERPRIEQRHTSTDACITVASTATGFIITPRLRTATNDAAGITASITASNTMQLYDVMVVNNDGEAAYSTALADLDVSTVPAWGVPSSIT